MTDQSLNAALEPTQADRTATADLLDELSSLLDHVGIGQVADLIRDGEYDEHDAVQAFARHRLASSPAAEPVAWMYERTWEDYTPSREVRVQQWSTTEGRYAGWTETPLYAALATPPDGDAEVRKGLEIAQGIVESDLIDAKEHADADWIGQSQAALDAITTLLATPPSVPAQQGEGDEQRDRVIMSSVRLGRWMSAALDDPNVCEEMKADIQDWFSAGEPVVGWAASLSPSSGEPASDACTVCGIANRNHHTHLAPFNENFHPFGEPASVAGEASMLDDRAYRDMEPRTDRSSPFMRFWNAANERRTRLGKAELKHGEAKLLWHIATGEGPIWPSDREV